MKAKKNQSRVSPPKAAKLEKRCRTLERQQRRLRDTIKELQAERDQFRRSVIALMRQEIAFEKKDLLAMAGKQPSIWKLIDELKAQGA